MGLHSPARTYEDKVAVMAVDQANSGAGLGGASDWQFNRVDEIRQDADHPLHDLAVTAWRLPRDRTE